MENEEKKEIQEEVLTPPQEAFCRFYTQIKDLFGNATLAYAEAYGYDLEMARRDDAQYKFQDGTIYARWELDLITDKDEKDKYSVEKGELIQESSYDREYAVCSVCSSKLLRKAKIDNRVTVLLNELMTDEQIDAEIARVIRQDRDLPSKMKAIVEYNKLKQRIVDKKDITSGGKPLNISFDPVFNTKE